MKGFFRGLGKIALWGLFGLGIFVLYSNVEKETALWISGLLVVGGLCYEIQTIKEKLDTLQWTLDDLRRDRELPDD